MVSGFSGFQFLVFCCNVFTRVLGFCFEVEGFRV